MKTQHERYVEKAVKMVANYKTVNKLFWLLLGNVPPEKLTLQELRVVREDVLKATESMNRVLKLLDSARVKVELGRKEEGLVHENIDLTGNDGKHMVIVPG